MSEPHMSFVIPAWNEAGQLPAAIGAMHAAAAAVGVPYEVIVADDASDDGTADVARALGATVVACQHRQIAATRNSGARAARGALLIFVDADTCVTEGAVRGAVDAIAAGATHGGANVGWDGHIPLWSRLMLRTMLRFYRFIGVASGAFLFCTREIHEAVGGFDESLYAAEEVDFSLRLKRRGRFKWVRQPVVTSGRKLRTYGSWELLRLMAGMMLRGRRGLTSRERLGLWYDERRPDPGGPGSG